MTPQSRLLICTSINAHCDSSLYSRLSDINRLLSLCHTQSICRKFPVLYCNLNFHTRCYEITCPLGPFSHRYLVSITLALRMYCTDPQALVFFQIWLRIPCPILTAYANRYIRIQTLMTAPKGPSSSAWIKEKLCVAGYLAHTILMHDAQERKDKLHVHVPAYNCLGP